MTQAQGGLLVACGDGVDGGAAQFRPVGLDGAVAAPPGHLPGPVVEVAAPERHHRDLFAVGVSSLAALDHDEATGNRLGRGVNIAREAA